MISIQIIFADRCKSSICLENLEVTQQSQQENDPQDDQASLQQVFQQVFPEERMMTNAMMTPTTASTTQTTWLEKIVVRSIDISSLRKERYSAPVICSAGRAPLSTG